MSNVLVHLQDWANRKKKQMVNPFISQMGETEAQSGAKPGRSDSQKELAGEGWGRGDGVVAPKVWVLEKGWWGVSEMQLCLKGE